MNIWPYIAAFLVGVISGIILHERTDLPETVIKNMQRIGKIKQRGEGNEQDAVMSHEDGTPLSPKEIRKEKRKQRREERRAKRTNKSNNNG